MISTMRGRCLCGSVTYQIEGAFRRFLLCHCSRCRHAGGSAHASNLFCKPDQLSWLSGEDLVQHYRLPEAQRFGKSFCRTCGSPVPHVGDGGRYLLVPAGSLEGDPQIRPQAHIFCADRAVWDDDENVKIPCFEAYPV